MLHPPSRQVVPLRAQVAAALCSVVMVAAAIAGGDGWWLLPAAVGPATVWLATLVVRRGPVELEERPSG